MRNKEFYNDKNKSVPGHAMNIIGVTLNASHEIIDFMVRGSWLGCDGSRGYVLLPKNFVLNHMYLYILPERAIGGKIKQKSKKIKRNKRKQTRRRV